MELIICPHCLERIRPSIEGECPGCRANVNEPPVPKPTVTIEEYRAIEVDATQLGRRRLSAWAASMAVLIATLAVVVVWAAPRLDTCLQDKGGVQASVLRCVVINAMTFVLLAVTLFPTAWYSGFHLERQFGLSKQTFDAWLSQYYVSSFRAIVDRSCLLTAMYLLIIVAGPTWWLVVPFVMIVWIAATSRARPAFFGDYRSRIEPIADRKIGEPAANVVNGSGFAIEGVYQIHAANSTHRPNACLYGVGQTRRLLLSDTLLNAFTPDEIAVIVAHEIGHAAYHHVAKRLAISGVVMIFGYLLCDFALRVWQPGSGGEFLYFNLPAYTVPFLLLVLTLYSLVSIPVIRALNRHDERQADCFAAAHAASAEIYRSAMMKLTYFNRVPLQVHWLERILLHDHPSPAERIALADSVPSKANPKS